MQFERRSCVEASATLGAQERFLTSMNALVYLYVALIDKPLATVRTRVGLFLDMGFHVFVHLFFLIKLNTTAAAEEKL